MPDLNTAGYNIRRSWSDEHLTAVKSALGRKFFHVSTITQDTKLGFDLCVPELNLVVRIRQMKYKNYLDFTLRTSGGGDRSEYAKLLDIIGPDYLFYGYALDKQTLGAGYLIDLRQWRLSLINKEIKPMFRRNKDGSHFVAFPLRELRERLFGECQSYAEQII